MRARHTQDAKVVGDVVLVLDHGAFARLMIQCLPHASEKHRLNAIGLDADYILFMIIFVVNCCYSLKFPKF